jgi:hypothetical protein
MVARLYALFLHFGGLGLLALGVLDSSLLVMPLANDLLLVASCAARVARKAWEDTSRGEGSTMSRRR